MRKYFTSLLFVLFATLSFGQKTDKPDFTYDLGGKIEMMKLTEAGILLVTGGGGLVGIKAGDTKPHFVFQEYGKVKEEELEFVPRSPYVIVNQGGLMSQKKSVIDYVAGKLLFATEEKGWKQLFGLNVLLPQNKLVVNGTRTMKEGGAMAVGVYDLGTG
ncbi:MAG TPA: hypothetical protein VIK74_09810, partial [Parasegetibacter sp.]